MLCWNLRYVAYSVRKYGFTLEHITNLLMFDSHNLLYTTNQIKKEMQLILLHSQSTMVFSSSLVLHIATRICDILFCHNANIYVVENIVYLSNSTLKGRGGVCVVKMFIFTSLKIGSIVTLKSCRLLYYITIPSAYCQMNTFAIHCAFQSQVSQWNVSDAGSTIRA